MKVKFLPKNQQGGVFSSLFSVYKPTPSPTTGATAATATTKKSNDSDLTDKDILKMLNNLDGLPSDVESITNNLHNFFLSSPLSSPSISPLSSSSIAARYVNILEKMKVAKFNKQEYDNAYKRLDSNGGLEELAVTDRGQFVCTNGKGDYQLMTADQLKDFEGQYYALTNSELLKARAYQKNVAFDNNLIQVARNGIGMKNITDYIQNALENLGSTEESEQGYAKTRKGMLAAGIEGFQQAVAAASAAPKFNGTINDLYKYQYMTKTQADQAGEALNYIYQTMPENMKALLRSKADMTDEGAFTLVQKLVASKVDTKRDFGLSFVSPSQYKGSGLDKDDSDLKNTPLVGMVTGIGGNSTTIDLDPGTGIDLHAVGKSFPVLTGTGNESINGGNIADMMSKSRIDSITDLNRKVQFGDRLIDRQELDKITYGGGPIVRAELPMRGNEIDFNLLPRWLEMEEELDRLSDEDRQNPEKVRKIYEAHQLTDYLEPGGVNGDPNKTAVYLITGNCYTTNRLTPSAKWDLGNPTDFIYELKHNEAKNLVSGIEDQLNAGWKKGQHKISIDTRQYLNPFDWTKGNYEHIYKGCVFIPIGKDVNVAAMGDKQKLDYDETVGYEWQNQLSEEAPYLQTTSSSVLNNNI